MARRTSMLVSWAVAATLVAAMPATDASGAEARGLTLATPGTSLPVTFNATRGDSVFFSTEQALVGTDTDTNLDVYRSTDGTLALMTPDSPFDVMFDAVSSNGAVVIGSHREGFFGKIQIRRYTTAGGQQVNQTTGQGDALFKAASPDGNSIAFETTETGSDEDVNDGAWDVFVSYFDPNNPGPASQVFMSPGTSADAHFAGASTSFNTIIYTTDYPILPSDHNSVRDVYATGGAWPLSVSLVSDGEGGSDDFNAVSANGDTVAYTSSDNRASQGDLDGLGDVYRRQAGALDAALVSGGTTSSAVYAGSSPGLEDVFYWTEAQADPADTDTAVDTYVHNAGGDILLTAGSQDLDAFPASVPDGPGKTLAFTTQEALATADGDSNFDVYGLDTNDDPVLLSGQGSGDIAFVGQGDNGAIYFLSLDRLTAADTDDTQDLYVNEAGTLTLVSLGTRNAAFFEGSSADGSRVVISSAERLTAGDSDDLRDIYSFGPVTAAPSPPPPPDTTAPTATTTAKPQKNDGALEVTVTCSEACTATPSGALTVPTAAARGKRTFTLRGSAVSVAAGGKATLKLRVPKKAKKAVAAALKAGKKVTAKVTVVVVDAAGNKRTVTATVKLKK